jgi:YidC/Oxa1 family membrane protein insertase
MEKDRTIIAILLSMIAILIYFQFMTPKPAPQAPKPAPGETVQEKPSQPVEPAKPEPVIEEKQTPEPEIVEIPSVPAQGDSVQTGALKLGWKNGAAAFSEITLTAKKEEQYLYPDHTRERPLRLLFSESGDDFALRMCKADSVEDIVPGNWKVVSRSAEKIVMQASVKKGLVATKTLTFEKDKYHVILELRLENTTSQPITSSYRLLVANGILEEAGTRMPGGSLVAHRVEGSVEVIRNAPNSLTDKEPSKVFSAGGVWAGLENMYFATVLAPEDEVTRKAVDTILVERMTASPEKKTDAGSKEPKLINMRVIFTTTEVVVEPGSENARTHRYLLFAGPKQADILKNYKHLGFDQLLDYGRFGFLSKLFLWVLRGVYYIIPNWGIAIIILTLFVRLCLHPVSRKSQMSMQKYQKAMQKLKPKLDKLKEKHKGNRQKLNTEMMKLYKEEGVSILPAGGCLLMILQIPVFIGLYWALSLSIELRQASFVFWINDLSKPDAAFTIAGGIPLLGQYINILPIIMLIAMIMQQRSQPKPQDPQQASQQKMTMYIMLFVIGFIFYSMPSGLVLYFLTSTLVGIGETRLIRRKLAAEELSK